MMVGSTTTFDSIVAFLTDDAAPFRVGQIVRWVGLAPSLVDPTWEFIVVAVDRTSSAVASSWVIELAPLPPNPLPPQHVVTDATTVHLEVV